MSDFEQHAQSARWHLEQASAYATESADISRGALASAQVEATLAVGAALQAIAAELQARNEG